MREEDARRKWCPMTRFHVGNDNMVYSNKLITDLNTTGSADKYSACCITSECMMWVETDNESSPRSGDSDDEAVYYPAGHCGMVK